MNIDDLIIDERYSVRNYLPNDKYLESLKASIQEVGLMNPILMSRNFEVIAGFQRLRACKQLGHKTIMCRVIEVPENAHRELYMMGMRPNV